MIFWLLKFAGVWKDFFKWAEDAVLVGGVGAGEIGVIVIRKVSLCLSRSRGILYGLLHSGSQTSSTDKSQSSPADEETVI